MSYESVRFMEEMNEDEIVLSLCLTAAALLMSSAQNRRKRRFWVRPIYRRRLCQGDYNNLISEMRLSDRDMFYNYTRMSVELFDKLLALVGPMLKKNSKRPAISEGCRLSLTLRMLATGDSQQSMAFAYRLGKSTVCGIFKETCEVLWQILQPIVLPHPTERKWRNIAEQFNTKWQLPNCVGALDGKHVVIKAPNKTGSLYFNYKRSFSIVLFAVCDAEYLFTCADIGAYGSQSDGGVLRESAFGYHLHNNTLNLPPDEPLPGTNISVPYYFVGDEAFPLKQNLLRPYGGKFLNEDLKIYNYRLSRARRCIENTFGIMCARWRIFHRTINAFPQNVDRIIKAAVCLHNFIKISEKQFACQDKKYCADRAVDREINGELQLGGWRDEVPSGCALQPASTLRRRLATRNYRSNAEDVRNSIRDYVNSDIGSVPWQVDYVRRAK